jgi:two-component system LytT family response regulator
MKALIVDDENKARANLEHVLKDYIDPDINIAGNANSAAEAEKMIRAHSPDVVFLDIEMPDENAFQFLERVSPVNFEIIFVTAYDEFAIKAFRLNAIDYILKPIRVSELRNAVERAKERLKYKQMVATHSVSFAELSQQVTNQTLPGSITLRDVDGIEIISFKNICYVEAHGSYSRFVFIKDGVVMEKLSSYPLSYYDELVPAGHFFRIHRSYILNVRHIKTVQSDSCHVVVSGDITLPVSRRRFPEMLGFLKKQNN